MFVMMRGVSDGTRVRVGHRPAGGRIPRRRAENRPSELQRDLQGGLAGGSRATRFRALGRSHTHRLRVRYSECDMQGHVFNAHWLAYFDVAWTELWRAGMGDWNEVTARGIDLVVADAQVSYRAPARFDDEIAITPTVERLGTSSITTSFAAHRPKDDTLLVEGRLVHVVVDAKDFTKREIPGWVREALA